MKDIWISDKLINNFIQEFRNDDLSIHTSSYIN